MSFNIITGTPGVYDPSGSYIDSGWVISGAYATHYPCNAGLLKYIGDFGLIVGHTYSVTYTVDQYISGGVKAILGTTNGTNRTAAGVYTEVIVCATNTSVFFSSDGALRISKFSVYDVAIGQQPGITVAFYEGNNKRWGLKYSFVPELQVRFKNNLFQFQDGTVWLHASNEVRNNFFGVQYNSQITIIANQNPTTEKIFYNIRVLSNRCWYAQEQGDLYLPPMEGKSQGMASRLRKLNFKKLQGSYFGDFMRNMLDPIINDPAHALYAGAELRGQYMEITLTNADTIEVTLVEIDIKTAKSQYTY